MENCFVTGVCVRTFSCQGIRVKNIRLSNSYSSTNYNKTTYVFRAYKGLPCIHLHKLNMLIQLRRCDLRRMHIEKCRNSLMYKAK